MPTIRRLSGVEVTLWAHGPEVLGSSPAVRVLFFSTLGFYKKPKKGMTPNAAEIENMLSEFLVPLLPHMPSDHSTEGYR